MNNEAKLRVLFCSPNNHVGGICKWTNNILDYYKKLDFKGLEIEWFYPGYCKNESVDNTPISQRLINAWRSYYPLIVRIGNKIDSFKPDLVHFSTSASLGLIRDYVILSICRKKKVSTALHYHFGRIPQLIKSNGWEGQLLRKVARMASVNIVLDRPSYNAMKSAGFDNVEILPNPLAPSVRDLVDKDSCIPVESRSIVFVGHMVESKGICELVEACREIPNVKVYMLGAVSDDIKDRLLNLGGENCSDWLNIEGAQQFEKVIQRVMKSELFVLPTYTEGFPNVIIESMACGKATVSTPVGAIADMLDVNSERPCGVCVQVKDVKALRAAIVLLLDNPEKAIAMGANASAKVKAEYNMDKVFDNLVNIWKKYQNEH